MAVVKRLFIAEKPELGRAIAEGLGGGTKHDGYIDCGGDVVTWCFGHLLELCEPEDYDGRHKKWDLATLPIVMMPWRYKPRAQSAKQLKVVLSLLKQAQTIVHAGDPDEEGQLLVDELLIHAGNTQPVQRLLINDLTPKLVVKALSNLRDNREFEGLYKAALARSVADQHYGFNLTRAYTLAARAKGHEGVLSVGRVQTPILGLVVNRDRQHEGHNQQTYYLLTATFDLDGTAVSARLQAPEDAPVDEKGRITDAVYLQSVAAALEGQTGAVTSANTTPKSTPPPLPYNLLNLQADANKKYGLKPDAVLEITQTLREKHRLITYNRSDCQYLSGEQHADAAGVLASISQVAPDLQSAAQAGDATLKSRAFNSANVSAHHAIIPTETVVDWNNLSAAEQQVYTLIARAYVAQFYPSKETAQTVLDIECAGYGFRAAHTVTQAEGWSVLYGAEAQDASESDENEPQTEETVQDLSGIVQDAHGPCQGSETATKTTKPLARYTPGTLLKDLANVAKYVTDPDIKKLLQAKDADKKGEHGGIGTPATRSAILATLIKRGFLEDKGKQLISTELGRQFYDLLPDTARTPDMTAQWHAEQEKIRDGQGDVETFLKGLVAYMSGEVERLRQEGLAIPEAAGTACPVCGEGVLRKRKGKTGAFWGCSRYPDCTATCPDRKGDPDLQARAKPKVAVSDAHACHVCDKGLVRRPGKKGGHWWGCSGYPACKQTYLDRDGSPDVERETAKANGA